jgi:hypothetical protein
MTERKFYGKLDNFTSKEEKNKEKNHLNAYLHGRTFYQYGFETTISGRVPAYHPVLTSYED